MGVFFCAILAISLKGVCIVGNFSGRGEKAGRIGRAGASVERVETYFLKLYLIDCEIVEKIIHKINVKKFVLFTIDYQFF